LTFFAQAVDDEPQGFVGEAVQAFHVASQRLDQPGQVGGYIFFFVFTNVTHTVSKLVEADELVPRRNAGGAAMELRRARVPREA